MDALFVAHYLSLQFHRLGLYCTVLYYLVTYWLYDAGEHLAGGLAPSQTQEKTELSRYAVPCNTIIVRWSPGFRRKTYNDRPILMGKTNSAVI